MEHTCDHTIMMLLLVAVETTIHNLFMGWWLCLLTAEVHKATWYMLHYGGPTPKRHYAFSNSRHVASLNAGSLRGWAKQKRAMQELGKTHELVDKYIDSNGQSRWKGNKRLRSSEWGHQTCLIVFELQVNAFRVQLFLPRLYQIQVK